MHTRWEPAATLAGSCRSERESTGRCLEVVSVKGLYGRLGRRQTPLKAFPLSELYTFWVRRDGGGNGAKKGTSV